MRGLAFTKYNKSELKVYTFSSFNINDPVAGFGLVCF
jgi:hypothetical protein